MKIVSLFLERKFVKRTLMIMNQGMTSTLRKKLKDQRKYRRKVINQPLLDLSRAKKRSFRARMIARTFGSRMESVTLRINFLLIFI